MAMEKACNISSCSDGDPADGASRPRVFILSDIRLLREGVVLALSRQATVEVVGASDLSVTPRQIAALSPDVLLLDVTVPRVLEVSDSLHSVMPDVKVVALGVAEVEHVVMACAKAGVSGLVSPSGSVQDVVAAVHSAIRGELICSPRMASMLLNRVSTLAARPARGNGSERLTPREQEIMSFMSDGLSNKQIARLLGIQNATVKNHVHNILGKLRVRRRGEAAAQLRQAGDSFSFTTMPSGNGKAHHAFPAGLDQ